MLDTLKQWTLVILSLIVSIPIARWAYAGLDAANGLPGAPIVLAESPIGAALRILAASVCFGALAMITGRLSHRYTGAVVYGLLWSAIAIYTAPIDDLLRLMNEFDRGYRATFFMLALEVILWGAPAALVVVLLARFTPNRYEDEDRPDARNSIRAFMTTLVLGFALCWLMLRTDLTKQAVGGMITGMALAVMIARLLWPTANGSILFMAPIIIGVVGHVLGAIIMGDEALRRSAAGATWALSRATPIDIVGPGIAGVSLGISLARSFGHEEHGAEAAHPGGDNSPGDNNHRRRATDATDASASAGARPAPDATSARTAEDNTGNAAPATP